MRIYEDGIYRDMTDEETADVEKRARLMKIEERSRPLTEGQISQMLITQQINTLAVDDNTALRMKRFYPEWTSGTAYTAGFRIRRNDSLWRAVQGHTAQAGWEPENAASLWERIQLSCAGTVDDPIPYEGNMALTQGLYYIQGSDIYLCGRDTVSPVYHPLSELVDVYVSKV